MGSARASRAVFDALAEHTVRSAGLRPPQPRRLRSPQSNQPLTGAPSGNVLGIDPSATIPGHNGRPQYLLDDREPVKELV